MPVPNVQWITPDDGQGNCPKYVGFRTRLNLETSASVVLYISIYNNASVVFIVQKSPHICHHAH